MPPAARWHYSSYLYQTCAELLNTQLSTAVMAGQLVEPRTELNSSNACIDKKDLYGAKRRSVADLDSELPKKRKSEANLTLLAAECDLLAYACGNRSSLEGTSRPLEAKLVDSSIACSYNSRGGDSDDEVPARRNEGRRLLSSSTTSSGTSSSARSSADDVDDSESDEDGGDDSQSSSGGGGGAGTEKHMWVPIAGPMSWVQQQMRTKVNPRNILKELLPNHRVIPEGVHDVMLWKIIVNILCDQPRRQKLVHVNRLDDVIALVRKCTNIVVLTGAGVSVSCGIPDFRSRDGLYARISIEYPDLPDPQAIFDIQYFQHNPYPFFKFAKEIYPGRFSPSRSHRFIKQLDDSGKLLRNYTQNIDTLEQVVGIRNVTECHGSFAMATCTVCGHKVHCEAIKDDIMNQVIPKCPVCPPERDRGIMKPDIVFFGENLPKAFHKHIADDKDRCDLLIVIGSSLKVRPVALIPSCLPPGIPQVLINREPLPSHRFDVELLGDCDVVVSELCVRLGEAWQLPVCGVGGGTLMPMREVLPGELEVGVSEEVAGSTVGDALPSSPPPTPLDSVADEHSPKSATAAVIDDVQSLMETSRGGSCCGDEMSLDGGFDLQLPPLHPPAARSRAGSNATVSMQSINGDASPAAVAFLLDDVCGAGVAADSSEGFAGRIAICAPTATAAPTSREHEERLLSDRAEEYNRSGKTGLAALQERWLEKPSHLLSSRLIEHTYLFVPPSRYVFPGAEVYSDDSDDESDCEGTTVNEEPQTDTSDEDERSNQFMPPEDEDAHDSFPENSSCHSLSTYDSGSSSNSTCPFDAVNEGNT